MEEEDIFVANVTRMIKDMDMEPLKDERELLFGDCVGSKMEKNRVNLGLREAPNTVYIYMLWLRPKFWFRLIFGFWPAKILVSPDFWPTKISSQNHCWPAKLVAKISIGP
jgi:hypothetical protein